jgi:hypothetical protein
MVEVLADLHLVDARRYLEARTDSTYVAGAGGVGPGGVGSGDAETDGSTGTTGESGTPNAAASAYDASTLADRLSAGQPVDSVLGVHAVTRKQYEETVDWYVDHPDDFVNLYNRVLDRLNQVR